MGRWALTLTLLIGMTAPARADRKDTIVAILPFTFSDKDLAIYSKAAATALAAELRGTKGVKVQALSLSESIPSGVSIVVDGRLVQPSPGKVKIEFTVRDPEFGVTVATVPTKVAPLSEIDTLVSGVGGRLQRAIARARTEQKRRRAERNKPIRARPTVVRGESDRLPEPAENGDERQRMIVVLATGEVAGGAVPVRSIATEAGFRLSEHLGYRPMISGNDNVMTHADAGALAKKEGAVGTLKLHVRDVDFDWVGVLTARGKVRVVLTSPAGKVLFDRTVKTDTVVGSRGDRHSAIVRMVLDQAIDIAAPPIRKTLSR